CTQHSDKCEQQEVAIRNACAKPVLRLGLAPRLRFGELGRFDGCGTHSLLVHQIERQKVGIEETECKCSEKTGQNPKANDHMRLWPTEKLKVMVNRRHAEQTFLVEGLKCDNLQDYRDGLDYKEAAHNQQ